MLKLIVQYNNKKQVSLVLIFFLLTLIPKHCPTQYPHLPDYPPQFSADVTTISQNSPQAEVTKVYRDNNKERIETTINATKIVTIILIDEQKSIQLEPESKSYFYLPVDTTEFQRFIDPSLWYTMFSGAKYTLVSQEIIDGQACDKYQIIVTNDKLKEPKPAEDYGFSWINKTTNLPVKIVTKDFTAVLTNIQLRPQNPSLFEIPSGYVNPHDEERLSYIAFFIVTTFVTAVILYIVIATIKGKRKEKKT